MILLICLTNQFNKMMGVKPNLQDVTPFQTNLCIFGHQREPDAPVETANLAISTSDNAKD